VVWVGRDDNEPIGLSGAAGAMSVWGQMMAGLDPEPLLLPEPENIEHVWIDPATGLRSEQGCQNAVEVPFIAGSAPTESVACNPGSVGETIKGWLERVFQ
jgi:penicillin-binding protein 1B